jgi:hypothetical protein
MSTTTPESPDGDVGMSAVATVLTSPTELRISASSLL